MTLKASVIVLGYNGRGYLHDCLGTVLDQSLAPAEYEVTYADNGSADGSIEFVRAAFPTVRILDLGVNHGYARGNNLAFGKALGEVIVFLNQDTEVARSWLSELLAPFADPDTVLAQPALVTPWHPGYPSGVENDLPGFMMDVSRLGYVRYLEAGPGGTANLYASGASLAARRSWLTERGYAFEESFRSYAEDLELALAARLEGRDVRFARESMVVHKHRLDARLSPVAFAKTVRIIRNRLLAFYLHCSWLEMAPVLTVVAIGAPFNSREFGLKGIRSVLYGAALCVASPLAVASAIAPAVQLRKTRAGNLGRRRQPRWWLLRALWRQPV